MIETLIHLGMTLVSVVVAYFILRERVVKLETRYEAHVEKIEHIMEKLAKGSSSMENLDRSINQLNVTIAELKTIIRERK